jgi:putative FmdB family regulatory protein
MPTYEYMCGACGVLFDEVRSVDARNMVVCPQCGSMPPHVYQVFSTPRYVIPDIPEYIDRGMGNDNGVGVRIRGRKQRREEMRKRGLMEAGDTSEVKKAKELLEEHAERNRSRPKE